LENIFLYILRGQASGKERSDFFKDLDTSPSRKREFMAFEKLWVINNMAFKKTSEKKKKSEFQQVWNKTHRKTWVPVGYWLSGAAAVFIGLLMVTRFLFPEIWPFYVETIELKAPRGNISQIELKDGSKIWLNSGTTIKIDIRGKKSTICELNGEAFFDIPHNAHREFVVQIGEYQIYDLGTKFNVDYCQEKSVIRAALFEGDLEFRKKDCLLLSDLSPGKMFYFNTTSETISVTDADKDFITAWKHGKFVFVNKTLGQIAKELEEWYDVRFVFKNDKIQKDVFSGVIKRRTSMEHLLRVLELSSEMDYTVEDKEDGSCVVVFE
jgi:transmembrane sensor